jgi:hypothetical protein
VIISIQILEIVEVDIDCIVSDTKRDGVEGIIEHASGVSDVQDTNGDFNVVMFL